MDLAVLEQWQLLSWLLYRRAVGELDKFECVGLHHLLLLRVGEHYQQIMCAPPDDVSKEAIRISVCDRPVQLEIFDARGEGELLSSADDLTNRTSVCRLLQRPIVACEVSSVDYVQSLLQRLIDKLSAQPPLTAEALSTAQSQSSRRGRKWKKFRRDPVLFFTDFFRKLLGKT